MTLLSSSRSFGGTDGWYLTSSGRRTRFVDLFTFRLVIVVEVLVTLLSSLLTRSLSLSDDEDESPLRPVRLTILYEFSAPFFESSCNLTLIGSRPAAACGLSIGSG